jgi:hypothetical protein
MISRGALLRFFAVLALARSSSVAAAQWTFCVASQSETKNVWITRVFPAATRREALEVELEALLKREQRSLFVAQCPQPSEDKVGVINSQTAADEFNRKLGMTLYEIPARDFPLSR